jgi:hypothetical protein
MERVVVAELVWGAEEGCDQGRDGLVENCHCRQDPVTTTAVVAISAM